MTREELSQRKSDSEYNHYKDVAIELCKIIYDAIAQAGEEGIPNGHLYAMISPHMGLDLYLHLLGTLKKHGFVQEKFYVLTAHDPAVH